MVEKRDWHGGVTSDFSFKAVVDGDGGGGHPAKLRGSCQVLMKVAMTVAPWKISVRDSGL